MPQNKKGKPQVKALASRVVELESQLAEANENYTNVKKLWSEEMQKSSRLPQIEMENNQIKAREELTALIAAGKNLEAINFLQTTQVLLFKVDVRFADDRSFEKAQEEMFDKVKKVMIENVDQLRLKHSNGKATEQAAA